MKKQIASLTLAGLSLIYVQAGATTPAPHLSVTVTIEGYGQNQSARQNSRWKTRESLTAEVSMLPGLVSNTNPMDIAGNGARTQQQFNEARARAPSPEKQKEVLTQGRAAIENCRGDLSCITRVSQQLGAATSSWAVRPVDHSADAGRFLIFGAPGPEQCQADYHVNIQRHGEGQMPDVQGMVPFTTTTTSAYQANALERQTFCTKLFQIVLDTRNNRLFVPRLPLTIQGHYVHTEGSHTPIDNPQASVALQEDAMAWVQEKLNGAPPSGSDRVLLHPPHKGEGSGDNTVRVEMSWKLSYQ